MSQAALPWRAVLGYGVGDVANNFSFALGLLFLLHYYTDVAGIPAAAAGTLLLLVRVYDAFMDLAAGRLIDRHRGHPRWGRLRPYVLFGALPLLLLNVAVFSVPAGWSPTARLAYAYVSYALLGTAYAFVSIAYGSLASAMTQLPQERARLGVTRTLLASATMVVLAFAVAPQLRSLQGAALQTQMTQLTVALAVLGLPLYLLCVLSTRETVPRRTQAPAWRDSLVVLRANRPLQRLCLVALCALAGASCAGASSIYFVRYVLGDSALLTTTILVSSLAGMTVGLPLAPWLARRLGKVRSFQCGMVVAALGHLGLLWVPASHFGGVLVCMAAGGAGTALAMALMWALEADTVEYGESLSGLRLEGSNYALFSLTRKCGFALGGALPAFLLAAGGYTPSLGAQPEAMQHTIRWALGLAPALAFGLAALLMLRYPLSDPHYLALLRQPLPATPR